MVCHSAMRVTFRSMLWEKASAPRLAITTIEVVDLIEYIVVASPLSTRCKISCGVWGGLDRSGVFKVITIV